MAYAARDDVLARAGRLAGLFSVAGKRPDEADLDRDLDQVSAIIDAELRSRGFDPASISAEATTALLDVCAWAVLVRALPSAAPGDENVEQLVARGDKVLEAAGFPSLTSSSNIFAVLEALEAGQEGGATGPSAGSLWDELLPADVDTDDLDLEDQPLVFRRGMTLSRRAWAFSIRY